MVNPTKSKVNLLVNWCSYKAVKYACTNWHYSKSVPGGKLLKIGIWENDRFIGCVIFSYGATPEIGSPYGLKQIEICELTRIALQNNHKTPVSRILAIAIKMLHKQSPGIRMIVSFADTAQNHHGGIYQATNWIYAGSAQTHVFRVLGKIDHPKTLHSRYGKGGQSIPWLQSHIDPKAERIIAGIKHRYLFPLDDDIKEKIKHLQQPYPKRDK